MNNKKEITLKAGVFILGKNINDIAKMKPIEAYYEATCRAGDILLEDCKNARREGAKNELERLKDIITKNQKYFYDKMDYSESGIFYCRGETALAQISIIIEKRLKELD